MFVISSSKTIAMHAAIFHWIYTFLYHRRRLVVVLAIIKWKVCDVNIDDVLIFVGVSMKYVVTL